MRILLLCSCLALLATCSSTKNPSGMNADTITRIVYEFRDASVPPRYHRSYTIEVTPAAAQVKVTDYSDVLASESPAITAEQWESLVAMASELKAKGGSDYSTASGTKGYSVVVYNGDTALFDQSWDSMTTKKRDPALLALVEAIKKCVPTLGDTIAATR